MNWHGKHVLVTGAGGFIGSHLTERLAAEGATVTGLVHYNALDNWGWLGDSKLKPDMEVIAGDICDRDSVLHTMKGTEIVFHLAALISIPYSYTAPVSYLRTNIEGSLNIMQAARQLGVERVLHTSTSEVYGTALRIPIDEEHALQGQSPYSASKIGADKMVEAYHRSFGVPVVTVRPFNTFGPRQSARAVIPTIISQCLAGKEAISLGSLTPTRDMNYVSNTVDGYIAAASSSEAIGGTFNLGSGREISILDLANLIAKLVGVDIAIESKGQRVRPENSEVERLVSDSSLARRALGWEPRVDLEEGLERTISWIRENMDEYRPDAYTV
ncbi:GDP-mannose 4,6-dehydratase [Candidatus Hydrogenedentota bacterium]